MTATSQGMARIWLSAIFVCFASIVAIVHLTDDAAVVSRSERFVQLMMRIDPVPQMVVVGSSLSMLAFPPGSRIGWQMQAVPSDGAALRLAVPCVRRDELLRLLEAPIARGVPLILVEANHLLYSTNSCVPKTGLRARLKGFLSGLRKRLGMAFLGIEVSISEAEQEAEILDRIYDGDRSGFDSVYPARFYPLETLEFLAPALESARQNGQTVVMVALPRSETAHRYLGPEFDAAMDAGLAYLRNRFSGVVWEPARFWTDDQFADRAHVNRAGRARLQAELQSMIGNLR